MTTSSLAHVNGHGIGRVPRCLVAMLCVWLAPVYPVAAAQAPAAAPGGTTTASASAARLAAPTPPTSTYLIGPEDVLEVSYWREKNMSAEVVVRPDGKISLPLLNDIDAAGLTPAELLARIVEEARQYVDDPSATLVVKQINSRKVFITGSVNKPGAYALTQDTTVLQLLAMAGGLTEWAKADNITIVRTVGAQQVGFRFDYEDMARNRDLAQNIMLQPGDTVIVP